VEWNRFQRWLRAKLNSGERWSDWPWWRKLAWLPLVAVILLFGCTVVPILFVVAAISGLVAKKEETDDDTGPRSYWPPIDRVIASEFFGELNVTSSGVAWLHAEFPAFSRFGRRYTELAGWVPSDLPETGEFVVLLGGEPFRAERTDSAEYRVLLDWFEEHQEDIADDLHDQIRLVAWLQPNELESVDDRFRVSAARLHCAVDGGEMTNIMLELGQSWDFEHAWIVEITGITKSGYASLSVGPM